MAKKKVVEEPLQITNEMVIDVMQSSEFKKALQDKLDSFTEAINSSRLSILRENKGAVLRRTAFDSFQSLGLDKSDKLMEACIQIYKKESALPSVIRRFIITTFSTPCVFSVLSDVQKKVIETKKEEIKCKKAKTKSK